MQITIYLDQELVRKVDEAAKKGKVSRSRFVQQILRQGLETRKAESLLSTFGKIPDLKEELREHLGADVERASLP